jgi:hypothetical protein
MPLGLQRLARSRTVVSLWLSDTLPLLLLIQHGRYLIPEIIAISLSRGMANQWHLHPYLPLHVLHALSVEAEDRVTGVEYNSLIPQSHHPRKQ